MDMNSKHIHQLHWDPEDLLDHVDLEGPVKNENTQQINEGKTEHGTVNYIAKHKIVKLSVTILPLDQHPHSLPSLLEAQADPIMITMTMH